MTRVPSSMHGHLGYLLGILASVWVINAQNLYLQSSIYQMIPSSPCVRTATSLGSVGCQGMRVFDLILN